MKSPADLDPRTLVLVISLLIGLLVTTPAWILFIIDTVRARRYRIERARKGSK